MERSAFPVRPPRPVRYKNEGYMFESFDVTRVEVLSEDGTRRIRFDDEDVYCALVDPMTGRRARVHLQDPDFEL